MAVQKLATLEEWSKFLHDNQYVVVKFTAPWCHACKEIAATYEVLSKLSNLVAFGEIDIDENEEIFTGNYEVGTTKIEVESYYYYKKLKKYKWKLTSLQ